jgi:putative N6-adenine-specific DNA methylase
LNTDKTISYIATTFYGLEQVLSEELLNLKAEDIAIHNRAVSFKGNKNLLYEANLKLRTALRILQPIASFNVSDQQSLYNGAKAVKWENFMHAEQSIYIHAISNHPAFNNTMFVSQKVKDAIADYFREITGKRPSIDKFDPDMQIQVHISKDKCTISLDSSGIPLYKRGYRQDTGEAPINEVLAAGIVLLSKWDANKTLVDPMCGSGTILIEAALYALNIAPGKFRKFFAFQRWKDYDEALFNNIKLLAIENEKKRKLKIIGCDHSQKVLFAAIENFEVCGLDDIIELNKKEMQEYTPPDGGGWLISNPPYGERMGLTERIEMLYKTIGDTLKKKYSGYEAWIISSNLEALKKIGLSASRKITLYNGPLECKLMRYEIYDGTKKKHKLNK